MIGLEELNLTKEDVMRVRLNLRSALFSYFCWMHPPNTSGRLIGQMADDALVEVDAIYERSQQEGEIPL